MMEENDHEWVLKFIEVVKSKPAIYDRTLQDYSNVSYKKELWNEICETMSPNWKDLTPQGRMLKCKDAQQRWKSLRSCLKREVNEQMKEKSGLTPKKRRRKYIYFQNLLFLLPHMEDGPSVMPGGNGAGANNSDSNFDSSRKQYTPGYNNADTSAINRKDCSFDSNKNCSGEDIIDTLDTMFPGTRSEKRSSCAYEEPSSKVAKQDYNLRNHSQDSASVPETDEDRLFLKSLLPYFRAMSFDQKLEAKIEILKVVKTIKASANT